jgi:hypothetical protein
LKSRKAAAQAELKLIMNDHKNYPINYNHYYTDTIAKRRQDRQKTVLAKQIEDASTTDYNSKGQFVSSIDVAKVVTQHGQRVDPNMDNFSCEEALDCLFSIYKVCLPKSYPSSSHNQTNISKKVEQKTFVANITVQVIERHIVHGLESIFNPLFVNSLTPTQAEALASEPTASKRFRVRLSDQIQKLDEGHEILRNVL